MKVIKTLVTSILLVTGFTAAQAQDSKAVDVNNSSVVKQQPTCTHYQKVFDTAQGDFMQCLNSWEMNNLVYPKEAIDKKIEGTVKVHYLVDKKGNFSVLKTEGEPILAAEGKRMFAKFPKLTPAKDAQGQAIDVQGVYTLRFELNVAK